MPSVEEVDLGEFREKYRDILRGPYFDTMFPQYPNDPYLLRFVAIGKPCDIACRYKIGNWHEAEEETAGASGAPPKQWRMRERFGWEPVHEGKGWGCFVVLTEHFHHGEILKY